MDRSLQIELRNARPERARHVRLRDHAKYIPVFIAVYSILKALETSKRHALFEHNDGKYHRPKPSGMEFSGNQILLAE
jgi:hypothetical protein